MSKWTAFYSALWREDKAQVAALLEKNPLFSLKRDIFGVTSKQWQEWVMPDAVGHQEGSLSFIADLAQHTMSKSSKLLELDDNECQVKFNFSLIDQQMIPSLWTASFIVCYLKLLRKCSWEAFSSFDQTGVYEKQLKSSPSGRLVVTPSTPGKGHGVVTLHEIKANHAFVEYLGEVSCTHKTTQNLDSSYTMDYPLPSIAGWRWHIDALDSGNISRFVNHSRKPNTRLQVFFDGVLLRLALVAIRDIVQGEEITLDYGPMYWLKRCEIV